MNSEINKIALKKSNSSSIINLIIVIAVVGVFASLVGKSCGKSIASKNTKKSNKYVNHPAKSNLNYYQIAGIKLLLHGEPVAKNQPIPLGCEDLISSMKSYMVQDNSISIAVIHSTYVNPEVDLDGSANGCMLGIKNSPNVRSFTGASKKTVVAGLDGREVTMNYKKSKFNFNHSALIFANGFDHWSIQIAHGGSQGQDEIEELNKTIFESVQITDNK
jgi:hypothetical protein